MTATPGSIFTFRQSATRRGLEQPKFGSQTRGRKHAGNIGVRHCAAQEATTDFRPSTIFNDRCITRDARLQPEIVYGIARLARAAETTNATPVGIAAGITCLPLFHQTGNDTQKGDTRLSNRRATVLVPSALTMMGKPIVPAASSAPTVNSRLVSVILRPPIRLVSHDDQFTTCDDDADATP